MIKKAHEAYNKQDYLTAFELYTKLVEEGNEEALTSLGFMYQNAQACEKNEEKALELYTKGAESKQPYSLFNLAIIYMNGLCKVQTDQFKAHELYMQAAEREVPPAM
jgi:TPR repeat protein